MIKLKAMLGMVHAPIGLFLILLVAIPLSLSGSFHTGVFLALPFALAVMGSFPLNDYRDIEKDRVNKPHRPLPSGILQPGTALILGISFEVAATACALIVSDSIGDFLFYVLLVIGAVLYNGALKLFGPAKGVYTAIFLCMPFYFVAHRSDGLNDLLFVFGVCLFFIGRELYMDIPDVMGDSIAGMLTLPQVIGEKRSHVVSVALMACGLMLVPAAALSMAGALLLGAFCCLGVCGITLQGGFGVVTRPSILQLWFPFILCVLITLVAGFSA